MPIIYEGEQVCKMHTYRHPRNHKISVILYSIIYPIKFLTCVEIDFSDGVDSIKLVAHDLRI